MKAKAKKLMKHPLILGSSIAVLGGLFANVFNFLFNLFMLQNLSTSDYGILAAVISIISYPSIVSTAVGPTIVRFAGEYFAQNNLDMVRGVYVKIFKVILAIAAIAFILFFIFIPFLSGFFHISDWKILLVTNLIIFFTFIGVINYPFLQAKLAFTHQVITSLVSALTKLIFGAVMVLAGLSANGAVLSLLFAIILSYLYSFFPLQFIFKRKVKTPPINTNDLYKYGLPSGITLFSLNSFIASDIILVKHLFDPHQAGLYAGLSLVSRVIFFLLAPVATVMFPVIVQKHAKNEDFTNTFKLALFLVFFPSILLTIFYSLFPEFTLTFFTGGKIEYLVMTPYVGYFGLYISLYSVLTIVATFYLSIKKTNIFVPIMVGAIAQIVLIYFFHETFLQIIGISLGIMFLLVTGLLLYYPHATKK